MSVTLIASLRIAAGAGCEPRTQCTIVPFLQNEAKKNPHGLDEFFFSQIEGADESNPGWFHRGSLSRSRSKITGVPGVKRFNLANTSQSC